MSTPDGALEGKVCSATEDLCTGAGVCQEGACVSQGGETDCDDNNPCTEDSCDLEQGCVHTPWEELTGCDDGDPCTVGDLCVDGECKGVPRTARECAGMVLLR